LEFNETLQQLFINSKKAYNSVRKELLHNIAIESAIAIPIRSGLKEGDSLLLLFFNFVLEFSIKKAEGNQVEQE
jgi:hypothetical protein